MSPPAIEKESIFRRLRPPQTLNYLIMTGAGLAVYSFIMIARGNDVGVLLATTARGRGHPARWTASPVLILLLTAYLLIDPAFLNFIGFFGGSPWYWPRNPSGFNLEDSILAGGLLAYTIGHFRLTSLIHSSMPDEPTIRKEPHAVESATPAAGTRRCRGAKVDVDRRRHLCHRGPTGVDNPGVDGTANQTGRIRIQRRDVTVHDDGLDRRRDPDGRLGGVGLFAQRENDARGSVGRSARRLLPGKPSRNRSAATLAEVVQGKGGESSSFGKVRAPCSGSVKLLAGRWLYSACGSSM